MPIRRRSETANDAEAPPEAGRQLLALWSLKGVPHFSRTLREVGTFPPPANQRTPLRPPPSWRKLHKCSSPQSSPAALPAAVAPHRTPSTANTRDTGSKTPAHAACTSCAPDTERTPARPKTSFHPQSPAAAAPLPVQPTEHPAGYLSPGQNVSVQ